MSRIKILSEVVASQIAAGEVVQRPASVVKELVDNSLDAGAGRISVEVEKGGADRIRVTDDGCGISAEELPIALRRHATSKIELEADLRGIQTHGFRGEALAAISSVSKVEIVSRLPSERHANRLTAEGGENIRVERTGAPPGTSIAISDLFYNTPARKKFMKTPTTEMERIGAVVLRHSLSHPDLHFELTHNGRKSRSYPPVPSVIDRIGQIFGNELTRDLLPVDYASEKIQIEGFVSRPTTHRKTAADLFFFVNRRFVRDKILMRALSEAYRASLPQRRYPVALLFIDVPAENVDVNVHPTKEEIRFADEGLVWRALYAAARDALSGQEAEVPDYREPARETPPRAVAPPLPAAGADVGNRPIEGLSDGTPSVEAQQETFAPDPEPPTRDPLESLNRAPLAADEGSEAAPTEPPAASVPAAESWRVVAQVFDSFIVCEKGEEMALFDQHALHERLQFEKLRKQHEEGTVQRQEMMFPMTIEVAAHQVEPLTQAIPILAQFGLGIEHFGDRAFIVRSAPADIPLPEIEGLVQDALADLNEQGVVSPLGDRAEKILARMSCRSAIKANERLSLPEMRNLIDRYSTDPILSTCPHGRPPIWTMSRREIEKLFDRP